jgi:uncharacterized protein (DUF427 family)
MKKRIIPGPGQESVWDYPRPPAIEPTNKYLKVYLGDTLIAGTNRGYRVLETSHPPVYYFPPQDVAMNYLELEEGASSSCEWKGAAAYWNAILPGHPIRQFAWSYPQPTPRFRALAGYLAFYPAKATACYVNEERVQAQAGGFYGGWITQDIVGPFKGEAGTWGW